MQKLGHFLVKRCLLDVFHQKSDLLTKITSLLRHLRMKRKQYAVTRKSLCALENLSKIEKGVFDTAEAETCDEDFRSGNFNSSIFNAGGFGHSESCFSNQGGPDHQVTLVCNASGIRPRDRTSAGFSFPLM